MVYAEQQIPSLTQIDRQRYVNRTGIHGAEFGEDPHGAAF